ncbi:MAG: hypothetical protein H0X33_06165 [Taibaiella sp.]|nr:hypothetical protein [Taibaiella sp.]
MRNSALHIIILLLAGAITVSAQQKDTVIKTNTIEIIQSYKPEIKQHPKPEATFSLPPADTSRPVFTYVVPQQNLNYTYSSLPLKPLALSKDTVMPPYQNYLKLGGGNLSTLYFDAGIGSVHGNNYETALHLHSISQQGNIKYQQTSLTDLQADGTLHTVDNTWHASLTALRNAWYYYGYDHNRYEHSSDSVKQVFTGARLAVDMTPAHVKNIFYHPSISASAYNDKFKASETSFNFTAPFSYSVDSSLQLELAISGALTSLSVNKQSHGNNVFAIAPGIRYTSTTFSGYAYIIPAIGQYRSYILPDIAATYHIGKNLVAITAGWQSKLRQNTYEQLTTDNPYIYNTYSQRQTRTDEVYAMGEGSIGSHIALTGRISWWQYSDLPIFLNNTYDGKQFNILYEDHLTAFSLQGGIRYQVANAFSAGVHIASYTYYNGSLPQPWHLPGISVKGDVLFQPVPKLSITAYLYVLNDIKALDNMGQTVTINGIFNIGGGTEYNIIRRLSVFARIDNLLNSPNVRWLGYNGYGFNIYAGVRLKF